MNNYLVRINPIQAIAVPRERTERLIAIMRSSVLVKSGFLPCLSTQVV